MNGISTTSEGALAESAIPKISSILFDMDGVLINSEPLHEFTLLELSERFGRRFESEAELQQFKGLPEAAIARLIRESFPDVRLTNDEITDLRIESILANFHVVQMIEGALDFVKRCQAAGFQLGLTTSASGVVQQLAFETFGLAGYFDAVITGEDIRRGKPDPQPYLLTAAKLGQATAECMVVEDAVNGVISGKAAGCFVVGLTTSFMAKDLANAGADVICASFGSLGSKMFNNHRLCPSAGAGARTPTKL